MELYHNTVQDSTGAIINGATVTVRKKSDGTLASIFDIDEVAMSNPFVSGYDRSRGEIDFKAEDGTYTVNVVGETTTEIEVTLNYTGELFSYTPVVKGGTTVGTYNATNEAGTYIISGKRCSGEITLTWDSHTGTGSLIVTLPIASAANTRGGVDINRMAGLTRPSSDVVEAYISPGTNEIKFNCSTSAGVESAVQVDAAVTLLSLSFSYIID